MDNYDLVLEYLLSEGYSHKEATRIMVNEGWFQDLLGVAKKRLSTPLKTAATDAAATAIATTPANTTRPALPPQPAPIVRQVAAQVNLNPLQQLKAPVKKVINVVRQLNQLNPAKPPAGILPQGKPGGSVVPASKPGAVTPSAKLASGISNTSGSSVATTTGSGQVSTAGAKVRTPGGPPGGPLEPAGDTVTVQSRLSGTPKVKRLSPRQVTNFRPSVRLTGGGSAAASGSTASNVLGALKYVPHVSAAAIGLNAGPVADGTLSAARERGDYKPVQGPPAPEAPEPKAEVQQVVTKKKFVPRVKQPERPRVDADLQRYRDLVKKGKKMTVYDRKEAEDLGRDIYQRYRNPAFYQPKTA